MLSRLYKYATVAYVDGGFGVGGDHNVLEAAVYGKPVVFGPVYNKYEEAIQLVKNGGGISIKDVSDLDANLTELLKKGENYLRASQASSRYVYSQKGATEKIIQYIYKNRLLTR